jgi:hypothetical protein
MSFDESVGMAVRCASHCVYEAIADVIRKYVRFHEAKKREAEKLKMF